MRKVKIVFKDVEAGMLIQHDDASFTFSYQKNWFQNLEKPTISLSSP